MLVSRGHLSQESYIRNAKYPNTGIQRTAKSVMLSGEERGLLSRTAAGDRAQVPRGPPPNPYVHVNVRLKINLWYPG